MAALTAEQVSLVFSDGRCERSALFALTNVNAGDTVDLAATFKVIKRAGMVSATGTHIASVSVTGTVATIPTGPAADGVWLLASGVA